MDIVEWLRGTTGLGVSHPHLGGHVSRHGEAADEIDRLRVLVKEAYIEGFKTAIIHGGYMDLTAYDASDAKAALDT